MKEQMFSGVDNFGDAKMIWVCGELMATSTDFGPEDCWRDINHERTQNFNEYLPQQVNLAKFTDLSLVWEREA